MNWHANTIEEIFSHLHTQPAGLTADEAVKRFQQYGANQLIEKRKRPAWILFALQFRDVMILILIIAAVVSGIAGDIKDTVVILVIIIINAVVGFIQEYRAEKAMEALKNMSPAIARVARQTGITQIPASQLVPGDIILLEAGDMVAADIRLVKTHSLKIEEASLTGESQPAFKSADPLSSTDLPLADRINMAYKSTLVTAGKGTGIVVATGMQTEVGRIAQLLQQKEPPTPLQQRLTDFTKKLSAIILAICVVLYGIGLLRGEEPVNMLLTAISLAVAAIPEALPAVITIALSLGGKKLVRKNALIRKLTAVETLGSVTYICTDKTGTLTQNDMTVQAVWVYEHKPPFLDELNNEQLLLLAMTLNHDVVKNDHDEKPTGDATEIALIAYAIEHPDYNERWEFDFPRTFELPFDAARKMMTTVHAFNDHHLVVTKGAVESILNICPGADTTLITETAQQMAVEGQRVLAYSCKLIKTLPTGADYEELESDQHFCGLAGMIDPPRPEAGKAIEECKAAGIVPVLITGDHPVTARAIAEKMGILYQPGDRLLTGAELARMPNEELESSIKNIKVYARVSPEQKLRIVTALQKQQQFVAMTGDGVNDAPALKSANIGVAMGITGTDVSKEAAHMILLDDNFATIVNAVKEGRRIYDNIRRFIRYILACNFAEILTIFMAPIVGLPIPLLPIHILWINLVTDSLPGLALAAEKADARIMQRPPRQPTESIFAQGLGIYIIWVGVLMAAVTLAVQAWSIHIGDAHWQTMVFTVLCFSQLAQAMACRNEYRLIYRLGVFSNMPLIGALLLTFLLQIAIIYVPFLNKIFLTAPLSLPELGICLGASAIAFHAVEVQKLFKQRETKNHKP